MMAPNIEELSVEETNVEFIKVDVSELRQLMQNYRIVHIPAFIFFKNKYEKERIMTTDFGEFKRILRRLKRMYGVE